MDKKKKLEVAEGGKEENLKNFEVEFSFEEESTGKRFNQKTLVSDCQNAKEAQMTISDELQRRGINPEKIEFIETVDKTPKKTNSEKDEQTTILGTEPAEPEKEEITTPRMANFIAKISDVAIKQGDTRMLKIVLIVGTDIAKVSSNLLEKFAPGEMVAITVEPFQFDTMKDTKKQEQKPEEEVEIHSSYDAQTHEKIREFEAEKKQCKECGQFTNELIDGKYCFVCAEKFKQ